MKNISKLKPNKEENDKSTLFQDNIKSSLVYEANYLGDILSFEWLDEIEAACPNIDTIIRIPKNLLIQEENVTLIEKSKRINVSSIKDLAKHTEYINKYDKKTSSVEPSKILDIRNEETYDIYENRLLYTLVNNLERFISNKEKELKELELKNQKTLSYQSNSKTDSEKVEININLISKTIPSKELDKKLEKELLMITKRIKRIKEYISSWQNSEMIKSLARLHIKMIEPPIKKTNIILKNPNFKIAVHLWEYILKYNYEEKENKKENYNKNDNDLLIKFLNHSFLIDYFVSQAAVPSKKDQKNKLASSSLIILKEQIILILNLLKSVGYDLDEEELLKIISKEIKNDSNNRIVGANDVKKKFQNAMEDYLERTQNYL